MAAEYTWEKTEPYVKDNKVVQWGLTFRAANGDVSAVTNEIVISNADPFISIAGSKTNKIGRKNKIEPNLIDKTPVSKAELLEIVEAVIAAMATGGVINESTPQYKTYK